MKKPARSPQFAGLAVLFDMFLTTHFMTLIIVTVWRLPLLVAAAFYLFFAPIEGTYLSSAFEKIPTGAPAASCLVTGFAAVLHPVVLLSSTSYGGRRRAC